MSERKKLMPLAKKPLGESTIYWCNERVRTTRAVTCEICGTEFPELGLEDDGYTISTFLGRQVVEECCGRIIDIIFRESGEEIAKAYLKEFAENPTDPRFSFFRDVLAGTLKEAKENIRRTCKPLKETQGHMDDIIELEKNKANQESR